MKERKRSVVTISILTVITLAAALFIIVNRIPGECAVVIIENESFLSDFEVVNNEVHIYCVVSLKNNSSDTKEVRLAGNFAKEAESGLLREDSLVAHFIKDNTDSIIIDGNSTVKYIEIEFVGEYAGKSGMSDRTLPYIEVIEREAD